MNRLKIQMMIINYIFFITLSLDSVMIPTILFFITLSISIATLPTFLSKLNPQTAKEWFQPSLYKESSPILFQNAAGLLFDQTSQALRVGTQFISFYQNRSEIVRIHSGGVGIGTTNAEHKLQVNGGISLGNDLIDGKRYIGLTNPNDATDLSIFQGLVFTSRSNESSISMYTSNKEQMKIDSLGNVYINSSTLPTWDNYYGNVTPPLQTLTVGGLMASRVYYFRGSSFVIYNGSGLVDTLPTPTSTPSVYYFQPTLISKQQWNPNLSAGCLMIPYKGLYQFQLSIGFPYSSTMTLFISKNIGKGKESASTGNSQMIGIKPVQGLEATLTVTSYLLPTDVVYFGMIVQTSLQLLGNKCSITATLVKQTL